MGQPSSESLEPARLDVQIRHLGVISLEDAISSTSIQFGDELD